MILNSCTHDFGSCPTCRGMALLIPVGENAGDVQATREANNRAQEKILLEYMYREGIAA